MQDANKNEELSHDESLVLEFLYQLCLEDYNRVLSNYSKIYDRINMGMALCSALLIFILNSTKLEVIIEFFFHKEECLRVFYSIASAISIVMIFIAIILLLILSFSRKVSSFDSKSIEENNFFEYNLKKSINWAIYKYIYIIDDIRSVTERKQRWYDRSISLIIISLICFLISICLSKFIEI